MPSILSSYSLFLHRNKGAPFLQNLPIGARGKLLGEKFRALSPEEVEELSVAGRNLENFETKKTVRRSVLNEARLRRIPPELVREQWNKTPGPNTLARLKTIAERNNIDMRPFEPQYMYMYMPPVYESGEPEIAEQKQSRKGEATHSHSLPADESLDDILFPGLADENPENISLSSQAQGAVHHQDMNETSEEKTVKSQHNDSQKEGIAEQLPPLYFRSRSRERYKKL